MQIIYIIRINYEFFYLDVVISIIYVFFYIYAINTFF